MRRGPVVAAAAVVVGLAAGCSAASTPAPAPSAVPLRTVAPCPAATVVPDDSLGATPDAGTPPTVVMAVGDALQFPVPGGARVGLTGDADPSEDAGLCAAPAGASGTSTFVAVSAGFSRIGVQVGTQPVRAVLVRVTP